MLKFEFLIALFAFVGQLGVLYLVMRMIKFASQYGKPWAFAFKVFFVAMAICAIRRGAVLLLVSGWSALKDGLIFWDRFVSNPILTCLYLIFLLILVCWWKKFFANLGEIIKNREDREEAVSKRENDVLLREQLIVENPNGVEIQAPKKITIELEEKKVFAEKVIIVNPKKVTEE